MKITKTRLRELIIEECQVLEEEETLQNLIEAGADVDLYVLNTTIVYNKDINTTDMLNKIRAIEGVTRASPQGAATPSGPNILKHVVNIKVVRQKETIRSYIDFLLKHIAAIPEVIRIRVLDVSQVER